MGSLVVADIISRIELVREVIDSHPVAHDWERCLLLLNLTIVRRKMCRSFFCLFFWIFTKWLGSFRSEGLSPNICYISYITDASGIPLKVTYLLMKISNKRFDAPQSTQFPYFISFNCPVSQVANYEGRGGRMSAYKPKIYRSQEGCCICKAKSSR